jgi:hypothetical protein
MTYEEAIATAVKLLEDLNVMLDPKTGEYHVIRLFAVEHYLQHYKNVAEVRVRMEVKEL